MLNMAVALSLRSTLLSVLPNHRSEASVLIKWPNDVVLWHAQTHRKCAGILVENVWRGSEWTHAIQGRKTEKNLILQQHGRSIL